MHWLMDFKKAKGQVINFHSHMEFFFQISDLIGANFCLGTEITKHYHPAATDNNFKIGPNDLGGVHLCVRRMDGAMGCFSL